MITKRVVSGIQPSGVLHLGNYLGAIKNWINFQETNSNNCFYFIADNHSVTTKFLKDYTESEKEENYKGDRINDMVIQTAACLLASGVNPKKCHLFTQSHIPAHSELMWILSCMTPLSWVNKMVQYKEKSKNKNNEPSSTGLYTYPILMAADILIYKANIVPVGEDQIQHIELTRDIAQRLNNIAKKEILPLPEYVVDKQTARIMSLQNGTTKMSKSDKSTYSCVTLVCSEEQIKLKITKAKTDSVGKIFYDEKNRPEISNLLNIYSNIENLSIDEIIKKYENATTFEFKQDLIKLLNDTISPIAYKAKILIEKESSYVKDVLREGKKAAILESEKTLHEVKESLSYLL
jgi:tryptophanyl-tRNA synthetase